MKWMGLNELRDEFLVFFEEKGHKRLGSFPLVPKDDNSLLLINSGMAPMKKWFLAEETPPNNRVCTCQKCIRTPDIERVGITARHGTFFEMLGNFSFQDYFKGQAIEWGWEFLNKRLDIPAEKLFISVYLEDDEAYDIWTKEIGISPDNMVRFGKEDNFWEHGTGPCGPCSEIYFDRGEAFGCGEADCKVGCECDRYMEVWNLVFSQFDSDGKGNYDLLENPNIDTGMGLERLACIMQGVNNLFEVDTVNNILKHVERITGKTYGEDAKTDISIRVITDHIRSTVFMVSDGILPSNEGRGYVLRRLLRRAARHGRMMGVLDPFLSELCDTVIKENTAAYSEIAEHSEYIKKVISAEEERFSRTIDQGINMLNEMIEKIKEDVSKGKKAILSGEDAFRLHDTFGFPVDLTKEIVAEAGIEVDEEKFKEELAAQRNAAKKDRKSKDISGWATDIFAHLEINETEFVGYEKLESESIILEIAENNELTEAVSTDDGAKENIIVVLDKTPFYAEAGGQIGDTGYIHAEGIRLKVLGCKKTGKGFYLHSCILESGLLVKGQKIVATVDKKTRLATERNHTTAHILQDALREVLGLHVHQSGSLVDSGRVRFDFTHFGAVTGDELVKVEKIVNEKIFDAINVDTKEMPLKEAKELGAMALFGEKYGDDVRVVKIDNCSTEFCGGTHVKNTAMIGCFKILSESSVAAGVRRIEGVTGINILKLIDERNSLLVETCEKLKVANITDLPARVTALTTELSEIKAELEKGKSEIANRQADSLFETAIEVEGLKVFTAFFSATPADTLRAMCEKIRDKEPASIAVLCGEIEGKANMAVAVGKQAVEKGIKAGALAKLAAAIAGGNGGGKPDFAMAGIKDSSKIDEVITQIPELVKSLMK